MAQGPIKISNLLPIVKIDATIKRNDSRSHETLRIHHTAGGQSVSSLKQGESLVKERTAALPANAIKTINCLS